MDDLYDEATSQLFKASGHGARIKILKTLKKDSKSAKSLAELFGTSDTYIHKHLRRLSEEGLIKKDKKKFTLSTAGRIFINSLDGIEVVGIYRSLWESHNIDHVPEDLLRDIRVLRNTDLIRSAPRVLEKFYGASSYCQKRLLLATDRMPRLEGTSPKDMIKELIKTGAEGFWLMGPVPHFQSQHPNLRLPPGLTIKIAPMDNIYMGVVVIDDKEAGIVFTDNRGSLDWDYAIYGKDPNFISWAKKNFWNMYKKGVDIRASRL